MKNTAKKIIINYLGAALMAVAFVPTAYAAVDFNTYEGDYPLLQVANHSDNGAWGKSASADAGDIVSFLIYYHNSSNEDATQVKVNVTLPTASFNSQSISGKLWGGNTNTLNSSVQVSLSSSQTLTLIPGSVRWYSPLNNPISLLNGQTGSEIVTSSGLNVGDLPVSSSKGYVVFRAQVSNTGTGGGGGGGSTGQVTTTPLPATNVATNSATLNASVNPNGNYATAWFEYGTSQSYGYTTTSQQTGNGTTSIDISANANNLSPNTTYYYRVVIVSNGTVIRGDSTSFTTSTSGGGGGSTGQVTTTPLPATNVATNSATLNASVNPNGNYATAWFEYGTSQSSYGYTTSSQQTGNGTASIDISANANNLSPNTTYYYRAVIVANGTVIRGDSTSFTTGTNGGGGTSITATTTAATNIANSSATLNASVNPNGNYATAWFEYGTSQSYGYTTTSQQTGNGNSAINISANITNLSPGTVYYYRVVVVSGAATVHGDPALNFTTSGQQSSLATVTTNSTNYVSTTSTTLNGTVNPNGFNTTVWFEYGTSQSYGYTTNSQQMGNGNSSANFSMPVNNLNSGTYYYYRAVAQNAAGMSYGNSLSFYTTNDQNSSSAPYVITGNASTLASNYVMLDGYINPYNSNTTYWFEYGQTQSLGYTSEYKTLSGSNYQMSISTYVYSLAVNTTYYYRLVARNSYNTAYGSVRSFTTGINGNSSTSPNTITSAASYVGQNSVLLNGSINPNSSQTTAWFEWGENASSLSRAGTTSMGQGGNVLPLSLFLNNLTAGRTYYFRAVAQNSYNISYGSTLSFTTQGATSYTPATYQAPSYQPTSNSTPVTASTNDALLLTSSFDKNSAKPGEEIVFNIIYKNDSNSPITNANLRVILPNEVEYKTSSFNPVVFEGNNSLLYKIGTINAHALGNISIRVKVNELTKSESLDFNSTATYTAGSKAGSQANSATLKIENGSALSASALDALGNLLNFWFVDLLLGALAGFGIYHFFLNKKTIDVLK